MSSNRRRAEALVESSSCSDRDSGCTASKAAMAASGRAARKTPSSSPEVTSGMASTRMTRPASEAKSPPSALLTPSMAPSRLRASSSSAARASKRRAMVGSGVEGDEVGHALDLVHDHRSDIAADGGASRRPAPPRASASQRQHARR